MASSLGLSLPRRILLIGQSIVFPFRLVTAVPAFAASYALVSKTNDHDVATTALLSGCVVLGLASAQRFMLRFLLGCRFMISERRPSLRTKIWAVLLKVLAGPTSSLFIWQNSLPSLPVPPLKETVNAYVQSLKSVLSEKEFAKLEKDSQEFLKGPGPKLHRYLKFKSFTEYNYVADWWDTFAYLKGRDSIMINSNYFCLDAGSGHVTAPKTNVQAARAGRIAHNFLLFKDRIEQERPHSLLKSPMPPTPHAICMNQYKRMFGTSRLPGEEYDSIDHCLSSHITVYCQGRYFAFEGYQDGKPLPPYVIESVIEEILEMAPKVAPARDAEERYVAALTACGRTKWAQARGQLLGDAKSANAVRTIETAAFHIVLEDVRPKPDELEKMGKIAFTGTGADRWFDKSLQVIVTANGQCLLNAEHGWADALVVSHLWEEAVLVGDHKEGTYDATGRNPKPTKESDLIRTPPVAVLKFGDFDAQLKASVNAAKVEAAEAAAGIAINIIRHTAYGKGLMKRAGISPDGFCQMILALAYRMTHDKNALTYESAVVRKYIHGRTETVRPQTTLASKFVDSMQDTTVTDSHRAKLLREACANHVQLCKQANVGMGVDRYVFALYIASKGMNIQSDFLNFGMSQPFLMSTSQQPQNQTPFYSIAKDEYSDRFTVGGGFGPTAANGYGISYNVLENELFFNVTSRPASEAKQDVFVSNLKKALDEMSALATTMVAKK